MLRELQTNTGKVYDSTNITTVDLVVGMGVVKDYTKDREVGFPDAPTDKGVFFVTKEKRADGIYAGLGEFSDYEEMFMQIKTGNGVKLVPPEFPERYATDQFSTGAIKGDYLALGIDGKFAKSADATKFVYRGTKVVDTHTLHVIEVIG
uniref:hypothetical protein n=1 Tax=Clostridium sp. 12(A) TaxID=1163671 RepID=UPI0004630E11|nr:hypothetical protein [Clostridium sp. 12(A)]